jgi:regulator of cell morphogenesis and NO signaling
MELLSKRKVGGIVAENFRTARVFTAYGIDFCCRGSISVREACEINGVALEPLLKDLRVVSSLPDDVHYINLPLNSLIDHIVSNHHS